jgi:hypothetical protein
VADIFKEVDEDLKRDQALELWRKYGRYIIVFAAAVVISTAAIVGWNNYRESQRNADARTYTLAASLVYKGDTAGAEAAMKDIAAGSGAYRTLAALQEGGLKLQAGQKQAAAALFDAIAADSTVSQAFRDLATILSALASLDSADPQAIDKKVQPLMAQGSAFRPSALEIEGLVALKVGDAKTAKQTFQELADDPNAPSAMRQRATQILTWIGEQGV